MSAKPLPRVSATVVVNRRSSKPLCHRLASPFISAVTGWSAISCPSESNTLTGRRAMSPAIRFVARTTAGIDSSDARTSGSGELNHVMPNFRRKMRSNSPTRGWERNAPILQPDFQILQRVPQRVPQLAPQVHLKCTSMSLRCQLAVRSADGAAAVGDARRLAHLVVLEEQRRHVAGDHRVGVARRAPLHGPGVAHVVPDQAHGVQR